MRRFLFYWRLLVAIIHRYRRRARASAAGEVTADAQAEMARLRQMTFDYLDSVMEHIDRSLSESLSELRLERSELNNHR